MANGAALQARPQHRRKISAGVRLAVYERDDWTCQYCGLVFDPRITWSPRRDAAPYLSIDVFLELDHVVPLILGGADLPCNLVSACTPCNKRKGAKLLQEVTT